MKVFFSCLCLFVFSNYAITQGLVKMVLVEGGTFDMGATVKEKAIRGLVPSQPMHSVTLDSFYISKYEVSINEWRRIMDTIPEKAIKNCPTCPVTMVSWYQVQDFIKKLNQAAHKNYRLPTEAEWEYAARGGTSSKDYLYSGSNEIDEVAWYEMNSQKTVHQKGQKKPNELDIYDMTGNAWEWCSDWYGCYSSKAQTNPQGPDQGAFKILRGSSWYNRAQSSVIAFRNRNEPDRQSKNIGFRLAYDIK